MEELLKKRRAKELARGIKGRTGVLETSMLNKSYSFVHDFICMEERKSMEIEDTCITDALLPNRCIRVSPKLPLVPMESEPSAFALELPPRPER